MSALEESIKQALSNSEDNQIVNKAYLEFIKANFIIPVEKSNEGEEPTVLYYQEGDTTYMPVFNNRKYLNEWVKDISDKIDLLKLTGVDLLKGIGDKVTICFNIGSPSYKEFNPSEIARMRSMILKIFK